MSQLNRDQRAHYEQIAACAQLRAFARRFDCAADALESAEQALRATIGPAPALHWWDVEAMTDANTAAGGYWFDDGNMRFFGTRHLATYQGPGGVFFVTSDYTGFNRTTRGGTVRQFNPFDARVDTIGSVAEHTTRRAHALARRYAAEGRKDGEV